MSAAKQPDAAGGIYAAAKREFRVRYVEDLSLDELSVELEKKRKLAADTALLSRLPDKGATIHQRIAVLQHLIAERSSGQSSCSCPIHSPNSDQHSSSSPLSISSSISSSVSSPSDSSPSDSSSVSSPSDSSPSDSSSVSSPSDSSSASSPSDSSSASPVSAPPPSAPPPSDSSSDSSPSASPSVLLSSPNVGELEQDMAALRLAGDSRPTLQVSSADHRHDERDYAYTKSISIGVGFMRKPRSAPAIKVLPVDYDLPPQ